MLTFTKLFLYIKNYIVLFFTGWFNIHINLQMLNHACDKFYLITVHIFVIFHRLELVVFCWNLGSKIISYSFILSWFVFNHSGFNVYVCECRYACGIRTQPWCQLSPATFQDPRSHSGCQDCAQHLHPMSHLTAQFILVPRPSFDVKGMWSCEVHWEEILPLELPGITKEVVFTVFMMFNSKTAWP